MGREKALFVVNSVYQLLTAVHLRRCLPEGWEGELLRQAMSRVEEENLQAVYQKETSAGAKFILQRDFGYGGREKPQGAGKILVELTGSPDD